MATVRFALVAVNDRTRAFNCSWLATRFARLEIDAVLAGQAGSAEDALTQIATWQPDILLSGFWLAGDLTGAQFAERLHRQGLSATMRIILWSSRAVPAPGEPLPPGVFRWIDAMDNPGLDQALQAAVDSLHGESR